MFGRIRDGHPDDWRPYWFLGAIGSVSRNDTLAENNFKRVTELAPWNADGWSYLAMNYLQKEKFQEVATSLEEALKALPDDFQVNLFLGIAYTRLQRTDEALHVLEHAHRINPKDIRAISQLALVYDGQKRYTDSDSLYEEGLRLEPQNHLILNNYAYSLCDRGLQLERALKMAQTAVAAQPDNASYLDTIGWVYFRLEQYEAAEKFIKMAIEKGEASAVVHEHLGDVYYMTNDKDRAMEQWNAALKLDENNQVLRDKISRGRL
jgi:Tfp pilus assembly protein PilF